jgi:hypothetical protein
MYPNNSALPICSVGVVFFRGGVTSSTRKKTKKPEDRIVSSIATAIHMDGVARKTLGTDAILQIASEVNNNLAGAREYCVDIDSVAAALGEYLAERIDERLSDLFGDWSFDLANEKSLNVDGWSIGVNEPRIIWDTLCESVGYVNAVSELYDFSVEFSEVCRFSSVGGCLCYEIVGSPDYPTNDSHLNADRPAMAIA